VGTLATVRDAVIRSSGRYDLGEIGGADAGANLFINMAQKFLDRTQVTPESIRRYQIDYEAGVGNFDVEDLMAIQTVHISTELGRSKLYPKRYESLFYDYAESDLGGTALYYALATSGLAPSQQDLNAITSLDVFTREARDIRFGNSYQTRTLIIRPVPTAPGTLVLVGRFFSPMLVDDEDRSYWTEGGEQALVFASCYMVETSMRNSTAAQDWKTLMLTELNGIDNQMVMEQDLDSDARMNG